MHSAPPLPRVSQEYLANAYIDITESPPPPLPPPPPLAVEAQQGWAPPGELCLLLLLLLLLSPVEPGGYFVERTLQQAQLEIEDLERTRNRILRSGQVEAEEAPGEPRERDVFLLRLGKFFTFCTVLYIPILYPFIICGLDWRKLIKIHPTFCNFTLKNLGPN